MQMKIARPLAKILVCCCLCGTMPAARVLAGETAKEPAPPVVAVVVGAGAPELERHAADELRGYIERLYGVRATLAEQLPADAAAICLVGSSSTNQAVAQAIAPNAWPKLTDQGLVLKRVSLEGKPAMILGGGSPVATMWAVYEFVERLGVRYLHDRDVYPQRQRFEGLPKLDLVMEPNLRIRCWRLINEKVGPVSWSLEENRRFLRQMAKMKYNRVSIGLWPGQPFVHYTFHGVPKPPGVLFFGDHYPIDDDTIGHEKFAGMKYFTNPELVGAVGPEEGRRRAIALVHGILDEARKLGMQTGLAIQPFEWPPAFMKVLPGSERVAQLGDLTAGPGRNQSIDDPLLREMIATIVRAYVETYPEADYLNVETPEWRQWIGQARESYEQLCARYGVTDLGSFEDLCARARSRTAFAGGGGRVETQVKGDLVSLRFFDSLVREERLLERPGGRGPVKLVYMDTSEELFPLVARMLPPRGEIVSFIDYTAARIIRQFEMMKQVPPKHVPASLIMTLGDDNMGVLPQLCTGSLHSLIEELRKNGWSGFYTRYWLVSEQDPAIHYLARASWDASVTPRSAYVDQVTHVCGSGAVDPVLRALAGIEEATLNLIAQNFGEVDSSQARRPSYQLYQEALKELLEARPRCRPEGMPYLDLFIGRMRFAIRYLDADKAYAAAVSAEKAGDKQTALRYAEVAYQAIRDALSAQAEVARDHGDLGALAQMNAQYYRPMRDKRNQLQHSATGK
jgi:hypothetical protein